VRAGIFALNPDEPENGAVRRQTSEAENNRAVMFLVRQFSCRSHGSMGKEKADVIAP
jgi:hypothetical protein